VNKKIVSWQGKRIWLVGASTGIGAALATQLQAAGAHVALSARKREALEALVTSASSFAWPLDVTQREAVESATQSITQRLGGLDVVIWLAGNYKPMRAQDFNTDDAVGILRVNYEALLFGLGAIIPILRQQKSGTIALVSSVAGYGGLPKSLAYGPTKAAMRNLTENLYIDLAPEGIGVVLISPGFVDTPLTAQNDFKMPALLTPAQAADEIVRGLETGQFEIAFPKRFTMWLKILGHLPYRLYFKIVSKFTGL
jgi:NAD(P)-dependent dehydrogenase (short-subunit alcohol dehydrogenase family)